MAGLLSYAAAGAVAGAGQGIVERARALREEAMENLRRGDRQAERAEDRAWQVEDRELAHARSAARRGSGGGGGFGAALGGNNILTDEEKTALGLPADGVYQRSRTGNITRVAGTGSTPREPRPLSSGMQSRIERWSRSNDVAGDVDWDAVGILGDEVQRLMDEEGLRENEAFARATRAVEREVVAPGGPTLLHRATGGLVGGEVAPRYGSPTGEFNYGDRRPPSPADPAPPSGTAGGAISIPQAAIDMLRSDPTPEAQAEFDQAFGPGAATRVLGRR